MSSAAIERMSRQRAEKGIHQRALGRSRGGFTSKIHCLGDAEGDRSPSTPRPAKGRLQKLRHADRVAGAGARSSSPTRPMTPMQSATTSSSAAFAPSSNRTKSICYNKRLYRQRNCIEQMLGRPKINRAIATRYDQLVDSFLGM